MAHTQLTAQDWDIRLYIYETLVKTGHVPSHQQTARHFDIGDEVARLAYRRLHDAHLLFLYPNTDEIMMAFPLSGIKTPYQVIVDDVTLYANCAWDSLGIPAMLGKDAQVTVEHPLTQETITYTIHNGELQAEGGSVVHYALPFAAWYDDLIDT